MDKGKSDIIFFSLIELPLTVITRKTVDAVPYSKSIIIIIRQRGGKIKRARRTVMGSLLRYAEQTNGKTEWKGKGGGNVSCTLSSLQKKIMINCNSRVGKPDNPRAHPKYTFSPFSPILSNIGILCLLIMSRENCFFRKHRHFLNSSVSKGSKKKKQSVEAAKYYSIL